MDCQSSEKATQLQLAAEKRTKTLAVRGIWSKITGMISWVPTIVYNEVNHRNKYEFVFWKTGNYSMEFNFISDI